jgi:hypothetical protein
MSTKIVRKTDEKDTFFSKKQSKSPKFEGFCVPTERSGNI